MSRRTNMNASIVEIGSRGRINISSNLFSHFNTDMSVAIIPINKSTFKLTQKFNSKKADKIKFNTVKNNNKQLLVSVANRVNSYFGKCVVYLENKDIIVKYIG